MLHLHPPPPLHKRVADFSQFFFAFFVLIRCILFLYVDFFCPGAGRLDKTRFSKRDRRAVVGDEVPPQAQDRAKQVRGFECYCCCGCVCRTEGWLTEATDDQVVIVFECYR